MSVEDGEEMGVVGVGDFPFEITEGVVSSSFKQSPLASCMCFTISEWRRCLTSLPLTDSTQSPTNTPSFYK